MAQIKLTRSQKRLIEMGNAIHNGTEKYCYLPYIFKFTKEKVEVLKIEDVPEQLRDYLIPANNDKDRATRDRDTSVEE